MTLGPNSYRDQVLAAIPANWLDPLLTGPNAALKGLPWECPEIEALLRGLKERIEAIPCGPSIPQGWKLVPVEPTEAMKKAGDESGLFMCGDECCHQHTREAGSAWEVMIAACPPFATGTPQEKP